MSRGKIIKGIAGFYYVSAGGSVYECKARGTLRRDGRKPLVGDDVEIEVLDETARTGNLTAVLPRRNTLLRPAVANIDQALVIFALDDPKPNIALLDRFLLMMERQEIRTVICFNKEDLDRNGESARLREIYEKSGYRVLLCSASEGAGLGELRELLRGKTTAVAGPSGVGKSSLTNLVLGERRMETGEISRKLKRGKHTTRHTQLIEVEDGAYLMDTPGFSSLDTIPVEKEELRFYFPELRRYEGKCRFGGCCHVSEPGCAVREAVEQGEISASRYEHYKLFYEELREKEKRRY